MSSEYVLLGVKLTERINVMVDASRVVQGYVGELSEPLKKKHVMELCNSYFIRFWGRFESFVVLCVETCNKVINSGEKGKRIDKKMSILRKMRARTFEKNLDMKGRGLVGTLKKEINKTYMDLEKAMEDLKGEVGSAPLLEKMRDQVLRDRVFNEEGGLYGQLAGFLHIYELGTLNLPSKENIKNIKEIRDFIAHGADEDDTNPFLSRILLTTGFEEEKGFFTYLIPPKNIRLANVTNKDIEAKIDPKPVSEGYPDFVQDEALRNALTAFEGFLDFLTSLMMELYVLIGEWSKLVYQ